jgi:hypothetical protein
MSVTLILAPWLRREMDGRSAAWQGHHFSAKQILYDSLNCLEAAAALCAVSGRNDLEIAEDET